MGRCPVLVRTCALARRFRVQRRARSRERVGHRALIDWRRFDRFDHTAVERLDILVGRAVRPERLRTSVACRLPSGGQPSRAGLPETMTR